MKLLPLVTAIGLLGYVSIGSANQATGHCQLPTSSQQNSVTSNKALIQAFFNAQNNNCAPKSFSQFFSKHYHITDIGKQDYSKQAGENIAERIKAFRQQIPNNRIVVDTLLAQNNQVFAWFSVFNEKKIKVMECFVLFTLKDGRISHAVEMVEPIIHSP